MTWEGIPADATCLIYLAKINGFDRAASCVDSLLVSPAVWREAVVDGARLGYTGAERIQQAETAGIVTRLDLDAEAEKRAANLSATWRLGHGESETLAIGMDVGQAIIDDGRASRVATAIGVEPISTLFLPVLGARRGMQVAAASDLLRELAIVASAKAETVFVIEEFLRRTK